MKQYNAITYSGDLNIGAQGFVKYKKISGVDKHVNFINRKYPLWRWITFFDRETNRSFVVKRKEYYQEIKKPEGSPPSGSNA